MRRALSRWARLSVLPTVVTIVGCASERVAVRDRAPRPEFVVVEPAVAATTTAPIVIEPAAPPAVAPVVQPHAPEDASVENWAARHPEAAHDLGAWAHDNPEAARFVFEYDGRHPELNREMISWAIYHPGEDVMVFAAKHPGWEWFDDVMAKHQAGAGQFLEWTRHHPVAVEELIGHPSGLLWVGEHLYAAEWRH